MMVHDYLHVIVVISPEVELEGRFRTTQTTRENVHVIFFKYAITTTWIIRYEKLIVLSITFFILLFEKVEHKMI